MQPDLAALDMRLQTDDAHILVCRGFDRDSWKRHASRYGTLDQLGIEKFLELDGFHTPGNTPVLPLQFNCTGDDHVRGLASDVCFDDVQRHRFSVHTANQQCRRIACLVLFAK